MKLSIFAKAKQSIIFFLFVVILSGCSKSDESSMANNKQEAPVFPVSSYITKVENISIPIEYPAKVKSIKQVQVTARVVGTLENQFYTEGEYVKKGTLLYKIDPKKYQATFNSAVASLAVSEAKLNEAERNFERVQKLYKTNALSQKDYDASLSVLESSKANVQASKAAVDSAKIDLDYTNVDATISGMTGLNSVDIGSYVGTNAENSLLTTITQMDPIYVEFSIPDIELLKKRYALRYGNWDNISQAKLPVSIVTPDGNLYEHNGTLDFFDNTINSQTASIKARASFKNPNYTLLPGLFVKINLLGIEQSNAIVVPQIALMQEGIDMYVYVSNDGIVEKVNVEIGESTKDGFSIVESGLKGGEIVIIDNLTKIRPGSKVNPTQSK